MNEQPASAVEPDLRKALRGAMRAARPASLPEATAAEPVAAAPASQVPVPLLPATRDGPGRTPARRIVDRGLGPLLERLGLRMRAAINGTASSDRLDRVALRFEEQVARQGHEAEELGFRLDRMQLQLDATAIRAAHGGAAAARLEARLDGFGELVLPFSPVELLLRTAAGWLLLPRGSEALIAASFEAARRAEAVMPGLLAAGDVAVDCEAGMGAATLAAARRVGADGAVVAVAPGPLLPRGLALNGLAERVQLRDATQDGLDALVPAGRPVALIRMGSGAPPAWDGMRRILDESPGLAILLQDQAPAAWLDGARAAGFAVEERVGGERLLRR